MAPLEKADLLQGTLDLLILKVVALGPVHGYGISQRIRQISDAVLLVQQARSIRRCIGLKNVAGSRPTGENRRMAGRQSSTAYLPPAASNSPPNKKPGTVYPKPLFKFLRLRIETTIGGSHGRFEASLSQTCSAQRFR
jgi:hypothetical protein